jgi:anti-sigma regulatory factor (Ser/Thr protein kinase)
MSPERIFPNAPGGVRDARAFVADVLGDADPNVLDAAVLMVSELATNAVVHTTSPFGIGIDQLDHEVRISVTDHGAGTPLIRTATSNDTDGRGLGIVAAFAIAWGVDQGPDSKTVWFTVRSARPGTRSVAARPTAADPPVR